MLLKGIKVLDLSNLLPGPMCSLFLADLGADVIKVESLQGDLFRKFEVRNGKGPYFSALNRNKKSIAVNLKTPQGKKIIIKLARNADVIIESFRPQKIEALGLGYNDIKKINSKIIYCSITGYGHSSLNKNKFKAGHDLNFISLSGLLDVISSKPFVPGIQIADFSSALMAVFSITASLFYRERTGKGNYCDISMHNSTLSLIGMHIAKASIAGSKKSIISGTMPCYNVYQTKDSRYVSLGAIEEKFWKSFCGCVGRDDLILRQFDESAVKDMRKLFRTKTMPQWQKLNEKNDFCCEPVKKIEEVQKDNYLKNEKILMELDGFTQVAMPIVFSSAANRLKYRKSPSLGEHTKEILLGLGYNKKDLDKLRINGIIN